MLVNLLFVAFVSANLGSSVMLANAQRLDCSSAEPINLAIFKDVCQDLVSGKTSFAKPMERFDLIQKCGCGLMRHDLAWETLYTHDVEALYYATKKFVEGKSKKKVKSKSKDNGDDAKQAREVEDLDADLKLSPMLQDDPKGLKYFWDKLDSIASDEDVEASSVSKELKKNLAETYYNPETFTRGMSRSKATMRATCSSLIKNMTDFLIYFDRLIKLTENPRIVFRMAEYNPTFFKLFQVTKICQLLKLSGLVS